MRDNKTEQLKKAIDIISKMDDKTFEQFTELCIQKIRQDNTFSDTNNEIIQMLQLLRKQSKTKIFSITNKNNQECEDTQHMRVIQCAVVGFLDVGLFDN